MFYISSFDKKSKMWGITDTDDGVTEFYTTEFILRELKGLEIKGVRGKTIQVVDAALHVAQSSFDRFESIVRKAVDSWTVETCMEIARSAHFVKKVKGLPDDELKRVVVENIYPQNIRDAVAQASDFSNNIQEIDIRDRNAVLNALQNNVCLVLQHKTNGVLTSFMCSSSLQVLDSIYEPKFFDSVYLTKQLYGYTAKINKVRLTPTAQREKNPNMLPVFSCALRFRREGKNHDGANKELSSPYYTLNLDKLLGMYVLVNPHSLGDRILPEFYMAARKDTYNFDFDMYLEVKSCIASGVNIFKDKEKFMSYVDTDTLDHAVEVEAVMERFNNDFEHMMYVRQRGYSFDVEQA